MTGSAPSRVNKSLTNSTDTMQVMNPATFDLKRFLAADTPQLDLGWGQFEKKINKYLEAFDARMGVAHKEIAERAHEYDQAVATFKQDKVVTEMDIKEEQQNEKDMLQGECARAARAQRGRRGRCRPTCSGTARSVPADRIKLTPAIEQERRTVAELTASLARFQASLQRVREQNAALDGQITGLRTELGAERATKERQARVLADMRERDARQLAVLEGALGLRMEGVGGE